MQCDSESVSDSGSDSDSGSSNREVIEVLVANLF